MSDEENVNAPEVPETYEEIHEEIHQETKSSEPEVESGKETVEVATVPADEKKEEKKEEKKDEEDFFDGITCNYLWQEIKTMKTPIHSLGWSILVFIINIFLAGIGTLIGAIPKKTEYPRKTTVIMGLCQFVAGFIFVGYLWSWIYGGFCIYRAVKNNEKKKTSN